MATKKISNISLRQLKELIENYTTTVHSLLCFVGITTWDGGKQLQGSIFSIGRVMTTSDKNNIKKNEDVTPDLIVQVSPEEGYVCEAKKTLSIKKNKLEDTLDQIRSYDDDLKGWWTDTKLLPKSNTVLLIEISRGAEFKEYALEQQKTKGNLFQKSFAFIEFSRADEVSHFIFFRTSLGKVDNESLNSLLKRGIKVEVEKVLTSYKPLKFYDSPPQPEYLMVVLWNDIFTNIKVEVKYDTSLKAWPLKFNILDLTRELQKLFGQESTGKRTVSFPNISWVREALDHFITIKLARKDSDNEYTIFYKNLRGDIQERFLSARKKIHSKIATNNQGNLFGNN